MTLFLAVILGCRGDPVDREPPVRDNVLILVLDDVGVDKIGAYGVHPTPSSTPRLDSLINEGVRFDRAYASPSCSPTRASILTGRHPSRHGIGWWINPWHDRISLPDSEVTFAELARTAGWSTGAVGKWHLSVFDVDHPERDPLAQGFDHFSGILANPDSALTDDGLPRGYWHWERDDDGELAFSDTYLTTAQADDALSMVNTLPEPWVVYVGFSAAHGPLSPPPPALAVPASDSDLDLYDAVLHALDSEIGRVLDGMSAEILERTTIVTIGDNGTPDRAVRPPWDPMASKTTVTEGGIRVPLAVTGARVGVPGGVSEALVHAVDVFATVADIVGVDVAALAAPVDGTSLLPWTRDPSDSGVRSSLLVEQFRPEGDVERSLLDRAVVGRSWKLVRRLDQPDELTVVGSDPSQETAAIDDDAMQPLALELERYERALR